MQIITRKDHGAIAVLTWDQPDSQVNIKSAAALAELDRIVAGVMADPAVMGVVIASAKRDFLVGGDLAQLLSIDTPQAACALVAGVRATLRLLETGGKPVVAALNGQVLGGGLELALACHARVAATDAKLGLPEVGLGLMPGAGGTQRLPRLIDPARALAMMTSGKPVTADEALEMGLVQAVARPAVVLERAIELIRQIAPQQPWDAGVPTPALPDDALAAARKRCASRSGEGDIAEATIIETVVQGLAGGFEAGLDHEAEGFGRLVASSTAKNRIRTGFFALNRARAIAARPKDEPPYPLTCIGVVGGGTMGGGIAYTAAERGLPVRLLEVSQQALDRGMDLIRKTAARQVKAGRIETAQEAGILARITPTLDYADFADVDLAIEAVVEVEAIKAAVFAALSAVMRPGAPIASNTSTLPITRLARACARPEDFIGLHFFGPVERMKLVEVVRGARTTDATLARSLDLMKRMGKIPVVVNDGLGFYTSRVVAAYTGEAMTLLAEGVTAARIDAAAMEFGMVIGPCAMNDMTGLPLLIDIFESVSSDPSQPVLQGNRRIEALRALVAAGRTGRRDAAGIYDYPEGKPQDWPGLSDLFPPCIPALTCDEIKARLIHAQVIEAARALEEGVLTSVEDADVGSLLGWMFPGWTGGVLSYVDTVGVGRFVALSDQLAERFGGRFAVPDGLRARAA